MKVLAGGVLASAAAAGVVLAVLVNLAVGLGLLGVVVAAIYVLCADGSERYARWALWGALVVPFMVNDPTTAGQLASASGFTTANLVRGIGPIALIVVAAFIARPKFRWGWVEGFAAAYLAFSLVSTLWSISPQQTALKAVTLTAAYYAAWRLACHYATLADAARGLATAVYVLLFAAFANLIVAPSASNSAFYGDVSRFHSIIPSMDGQPLGHIALLGMLAVVSGVGPSWTRGHVARVILFVLFAGELLLTQARTPLILAALLTLYVFWTRRREMWSVFAMLGAGIAAVIAFAAGSDLVLSYFARGQSASSAAELTGRVPLWVAAIGVWFSRPLQGYGYYSGHRFLDLHVETYRDIANYDSVWVESLVDVGLIGTVLLAAAVACGVGRLLAQHRGSPRTFFLAVAASCVVLGFLNAIWESTIITMVPGVFILFAARPLEERTHIQARAGERRLARVAAP